ncbi:MAG: ATP-binding cassette domain-containing protein [Planctomycetes bacterium]|nr:ATP-binding cassette domain-containing protein [Planctomycetota bacterium]
MTGDIVLTLQGLSRDFGKVRALSEVALAVPRGDLLVLAGPSGAGKTTLLRLANLLDRPSAGTVRLFGQDADPRDLALRRRMVLVPQGAPLFARKVLDNVAYGLWCRSVARPARERAARETLERVGAQELANRLPRDLSGGERARVALAQALAVRPELLLLDEATANLDPASVKAIEEVVREENARGTTVVAVTHNLPSARRLAKRVAVLLDGRLAALGPTEDVFAKPPTPEVLAFLDGIGACRGPALDTFSVCP